MRVQELLSVPTLRAYRDLIADTRFHTPKQVAGNTRHLRAIDDAIHDTELYGDRGAVRPNERRMSIPDRVSSSTLRRYRELIVGMDTMWRDKADYAAQVKWVDDAISAAEDLEAGAQE